MPEVDDVAAALQRLHQLTITFPIQSLVIGSRHGLTVAVDPGLIRALEEGSPIDGAVDEQATGRALLGVAVARDLALGLDAIADGRGADEIADLEEAELEGARDGRRTGGRRSSRAGRGRRGGTGGGRRSRRSGRTGCWRRDGAGGSRAGRLCCRRGGGGRSRGLLRGRRARGGDHAQYANCREELWQTHTPQDPE